MIQYIKNERHYELLLDRISKVKHTLWIGTADLKDLYIKKQDAAIPFLALLYQKIKKGVAIRLLHAKEPGENFRKDFDLYPSLWNGMERALSFVVLQNAAGAISLDAVFEKNYG